MHLTFPLPTFQGLRETLAIRRPAALMRDEAVHPSQEGSHAGEGRGGPAWAKEIAPDIAAPDHRAAPRLKLHTQGLCKTYNGSTALHPVDLKVYSGELLALLGPSGSGKTTLLQIICGLVEPTGGRLVIDGRDETDKPVNKRDIGVVFQNYALFPHLTVRENVSFPLQMRKLAPKVLRGKVEATLALVGLADYRDRFPRELSGGQQQRVALARCLVYQPSLILMDESLSALDRKLRESMQIEIKRLHRDTGATIIFVTHDQEEALALADRVCLMNQGRIEQVGPPEEIYERPLNTFVADFIGISNVLRGRVTADGRIATADGALPLPEDAADGRRPAAGAEAALVVRPEKMRLAAPGQGFVSGQVEETIYAGSETKVLVRLSGGSLVTVRRGAGLPPLSFGAAVTIEWDPGQARLLDR